MNHRTTEAKNRHGSTIDHSSQQLLQHITNAENTTNGPESSDVSETKVANSLLANILAFYKGAVINVAPSYPLHFQKTLESYKKRQTLQVSQFISPGDSDLERQAAETAIDPGNALSIIDFVFYTIVNLTRPLNSFTDSIEFNAKAVFNVVIASTAQGVRNQDYERLLLLCMYLKDTENRYPLRSLAVTNCLEVICVNSIPYFARNSILQLILGPADFIMYHLETRIQLSGAVSSLLLRDTCEDIEFRTLILRIAKKVGIARPKSVFEQRKTRLYCYLDLVVSDPTQYSRQESITAYMSLSEWSYALNRDLVLHLYLAQHKQQLLPFLEAVKIAGAVFTLFEPTSVQNAIFGQSDDNDETMIILYLARRRIYSILSDWADVVTESPIKSNHAIDLAIQAILEQTEPGSTIHSRLDETYCLVCHQVQDLDKLLFAKKVEQTLEITAQILQTAVVVPSQFMPKMLWITAICLRVFNKLQQQGFQNDPKICKGTAMCLDIFLEFLKRSDDIRRPSNLVGDEPTIVQFGGRNQPSEDDLGNILSLFTLLFPVEEIFTWCCIPTESFHKLSTDSIEPSVCADYLIRLFEKLIPHVERLIELEKITSTLMLASLLLRFLSLQIPSTILVQDCLGIANALNNIADLQKDSALSASSVWRDINSPSCCPHPFSALEIRLKAFQTGYP